MIRSYAMDECFHREFVSDQTLVVQEVCKQKKRLLQPGEGFSVQYREVGEAGEASHQYRSFLEPGSERLAEQVALRITSIHLETRTSAVRTGSTRSVLVVFEARTSRRCTRSLI